MTINYRSDHQNSLMRRGIWRDPIPIMSTGLSSIPCSTMPRSSRPLGGQGRMWQQPYAEATTTRGVRAGLGLVHCLPASIVTRAGRVGLANAGRSHSGRPCPDRRPGDPYRADETLGVFAAATIRRRSTGTSTASLRDRSRVRHGRGLRCDEPRRCCAQRRRDRRHHSGAYRQGRRLSTRELAYGDIPAVPMIEIPEADWELAPAGPARARGGRTPPGRRSIS